jgi:hypothetical protein
VLDLYELLQQNGILLHVGQQHISRQAWMPSRSACVPAGPAAALLLYDCEAGPGCQQLSGAVLCAAVGMVAMGAVAV